MYYIQLFRNVLNLKNGVLFFRFLEYNFVVVNKGRLGAYARVTMWNETRTE